MTTELLLVWALLASAAGPQVAIDQLQVGGVSNRDSISIPPVPQDRAATYQPQDPNRPPANGECLQGEDGQVSDCQLSEADQSAASVEGVLLRVLGYESSANTAGTIAGLEDADSLAADAGSGNGANSAQAAAIIAAQRAAVVVPPPR